MPTREVLSEFAKSEPDTMGIGPVHEHSDPLPQSLLDRHKNLAAKPNKPTCHSPPPRDNNRVPEDRVRSTGARTPRSLAAEIQARIKHAVDTSEENRDEKRGDQESSKVEVPKD